MNEEIKTEIESKLFEVIGIFRMIGDLQTFENPGQQLRVLESAIWSAKAGEFIASNILDMLDE